MNEATALRGKLKEAEGELIKLRAEVAEKGGALVKMAEGMDAVLHSVVQVMDLFPGSVIEEIRKSTAKEVETVTPIVPDSLKTYLEKCKGCDKRGGCMGYKVLLDLQN